MIALGSGCYSSIDGPNLASYEPQGGWVIAPADAVALHGKALFLDVGDGQRRRVADSVAVSWKTFSEPDDPVRGRLLDDRGELQRRLRATGLRGDQPVLVLGDPVGGWGEDGRVVWMLRTLGHTDARLVDGGMAALVGAGVEIGDLRPQPEPGDFTIAEDPGLSVEQDELIRILVAGLESTDPPTVLVDTREREEFLGATPNGERRGGHLPGAVHLHYTELLNTIGGLRTRADLLALLDDRGIKPTSAIIAYCTGGVRSGWFVAVLKDLGFTSVRNYAGSMWEWSAGDASTYPLVR